MISTLIEHGIAVRHKLVVLIHIASHKGEHLCHSIYLGMVAVEAHGMYRYAAGIGVTLILFNYFLSVFGEAE